MTNKNAVIDTFLEAITFYCIQLQALILKSPLLNYNCTVYKIHDNKYGFIHSNLKFHPTVLYLKSFII